MQKNQDFMKTKPILPLLLSMAVPMMLSMLIQSLYNIVDSIFVSRLGTKALTAVSLVYPLQNIIISVSVGMGIGINSVIAINMGAKNFENANKAATIGMFLTVIHSILFVILGITVTKPFLSLFTQDIQILNWACSYSYIVLCFSFGALLQVSFEKIFQAVGDMITTMFLLASGCIINIILDPIFIFGKFGIPAMGIFGAAIATVIGQISAFIFYIIAYKRKDIGIKIQLKYLSLDKKIIKQIYSIGIPSTMMIAMPSILTSILNGVLMQFSQVYVAVLGLYLKLQTFIYMPANGIIQGMRPIVSYNYGASEKERLKKTVNISLLLISLIMLLGTVAALVFPKQILMMFKADSELMSSGIKAIRIISLGFIISSIGIVYSGTFEALGKGKESLIISLLRQFIIIIPLSLILSKFIGVIGIWISFPISELIASISAFILFKLVYLKIEKNDKEIWLSF